MARIYYFISSSGENPVRNFIQSLPKPQKKKIFKIFEYIEKYGIQAIFSHTKKLTNTSLWEIRILGRNSTRIIYAVIYKGDILALHGFTKKSPKIPKNDLAVSLQRYENWKRNNRST